MSQKFALRTAVMHRSRLCGAFTFAAVSIRHFTVVIFAREVRMVCAAC
jgi:hypothetical protein